MKTMHRVIGILGLLSAIASHSPAEVLSSTKLPEMHRRPYEAVLSADERSLFVANRRSGTLSTVDVQSGEVTERTLGQQLSAIVRRSGSIEVLAVDFAGAEVVVLNESRAGLRPVRRVAVAAWPVAAAVSTDGRRCCVASLWSRRASVVRLDRPSEPAAVVDLPFAPRAVEMLDARHAV
ncbi:MAG: YncE family protein, partial [Planctomycetota bacterium]